MSTIRAQREQLRTRYGVASARNAHPEQCRTCKTWILAGLDADEAAFGARVDLTPLDRTGEAIALLLGLPTYRIQRVGAGTRITRRGRYDISGHPADGRRYDVVHAHTCTPPVLPTLPTTIPDPLDAVEVTTCPF